MIRTDGTCPKSSAKEARDLRREVRNARRRKEKEEEERKKSDQENIEKTRLELEAERQVSYMKVSRHHGTSVNSD